MLKLNFLTNKTQFLQAEKRAKNAKMSTISLLIAGTAEKAA